MANKNRIFYYDFLRAFAIIAVAMCHMSNFFGQLDTPVKLILRIMFHGIGLTGVPIFLMLTGALLLNRKYSLSGFFKKRFLRIFPPFLFWLVIMMVFGIYVLNWDTGRVIGVFMGDHSVIWYFWTLIGIYLFIPVINSFIREYGMKGMEYFLIIWFITIILKTFNHWPVFPPFEFNFNFELGYFTDFIGFVVLGYYLDKKEFNLKDNYRKVIPLIIFIVSMFFYVYLNMNGMDNGPIYQNLVNVFMVIGVFLIVKQINDLNLFDNLKNNLIGKLIVSLSMCSYGIYFAHFLVFNYFEMFGIHSNKIVPVMLIIVIGISWAVVYLLSKIPYVKKVCGV